MKNYVMATNGFFRLFLILIGGLLCFIVILLSGCASLTCNPYNKSETIKVTYINRLRSSNLPNL